MDAFKQKQVAFWKRLQALREGQLPIEDNWNGRWNPEDAEALLQRIQKHLSEGLVVFHPPPSKPYPYSEPIQVGDTIDFRKARVKALYKILQKEIELAYTMLLTLGRIRNAQMKQLLVANYSKQLTQLDRTWQELTTEIAYLKVHNAQSLEMGDWK